MSNKTIRNIETLQHIVKVQAAKLKILEKGSTVQENLKDLSKEELIVHLLYVIDAFQLPTTTVEEGELLRQVNTALEVNIDNLLHRATMAFCFFAGTFAAVYHAFEFLPTTDKETARSIMLQIDEYFAPKAKDFLTNKVLSRRHTAHHN